ncbi:MAG: helix-turn-helix domain-containing protein [Planctomycetota bacterium]
MTKKSVPQGMMSFRDACICLGISRRTISRWIKSGRLKVVYVGKTLYISESSSEFRDVIKPVQYPLNVPQMLKLNETCGYLCISRRTIYRLIEQGKLPAVRVGGQWRVAQPSLEAFLRTRISMSGKTVARPLYFKPDVLVQYRNNPEYYIKESAYYGQLGLKEDRHLEHMVKSSRWMMPVDELLSKARYIADLKFWKVSLHGEHPRAIMIDAEAFDRLPHREQVKWDKYKLKDRL